MKLRSYEVLSRKNSLRMAYSHGPEARVVKVKKAKDFFNNQLNEPNNLLENGRLNLRVISSFPQQEFPVDQETP